jgi:type I restriction enzyme S subunit
MSFKANDNVPKSWVETTVDDIYRIIGGGTPSTKVSEYWDGKTPWITSADISEKGKITPKKSITKKGILNSATNIIPKSSLVVVTRVGLGKVAIAEFPLCFSQDLQALVCDDDLVDPKYSFYYLSKAVQEFKYRSRGTTIAGVTKKQLCDLPFLLPPLFEQKRIAEKIEELHTRLDAGVESLMLVQTLLKRYRQSVLKSAVEGKLTAKWHEQHKDELEPSDKLMERILKERKEKWEAEQLADFKAKGKIPPKDWQSKYKEPNPPDTSNLPKLPKGWDWVSLEFIAAAIDPNPSHRMPKYTKEGTPFISTENFIEHDGIDFTIGKKVSEITLKEQIERFSINEGDFALSRIGTIGKTRLLPTDRKYCLSHALVIIKTITKRIDSKFLRYLISSDYVLQQAKKGVQSVGVPDLGMGKIRSFVLPIMNIDEQQVIVKKIESSLSIINNLEKIVDTELKRSQSLRRSILKHAFEGNLVPQDPNDEPASALLDKIKAEKSNPKKAKQVEMF